MYRLDLKHNNIEHQGNVLCFRWKQLLPKSCSPAAADIRKKFFSLTKLTQLVENLSLLSISNSLKKTNKVRQKIQNTVEIKSKTNKQTNS